MPSRDGRLTRRSPGPPPPATHLPTGCLQRRAEKPGLFFGFPQCHTEAGGDPHLRPVGPGWPLPDPKFNKDNSAMNCNGGGGAAPVGGRAADSNDTDGYS